MASASSEQNFSTGALETEQLKMDHRVTAQSPPSDNDSGERPVRQQLKETNLDAVGGNNDSARANRKRYLDNTDGANDTPPAKRSRECTPNTADSEDNSNHAELPKDATTQDVSDDVLATSSANIAVRNTPLSHNPIMSLITETKIQFPLELEIKVSFGGSEQVSHLTIPVEVGIKVTTGAVTLASSTSRSAEGESSEIRDTIPSAKPIPSSGSPFPGHPAPGHPSPGHPAPGHPSPGHPSPGHPSPGSPSIVHPSLENPSHPSSESYIHDDSPSHTTQNPESIGDEDSLPDYSSPSPSLPDYRSPSPSPSPRPVPYSPTHPYYPRPTLGLPDSNHSQFPQNLESTAGGNEDDSSQTLKKKRSREQLEDDVSQNSHAATDPTPGLTETTSSDEKSITEGQPEKKRPRDNSEERKAKVDQTFTTSAFGKAATSPSPFAMPANKPSDASTGPASTAGFGALGSGFSAFGSAFPAPSGKLTSFASPNAPAAFPGTAGKLTSFASANAPASFSGTAGNLTSFASANAPVGFLGTAGKLTSFASPNAPVSFGEPSEKTLGAKQPDKEESDKEPAGGPDDTFVAEKTDERFHAQTVETGEENETTEFTAKGKLYYFDDKKWKERGTGTFKVNLKTEPDGKKSGRVIMRADGALRVMMNSAIWKTMPFGDIKGFRPSTRDIYLASNEDDKVVSHLLRLGNEKQAGELFDVLKDVIEEI
ncbi:hypothetical protein CBS147333_7253 [Penicillium roqueforti]|nr:hypothetical protein CBS147333_7253 [Penicillium roqueforti]KAI3180269.1 hypothetical protein DTO046C5_1505 [Penicillium roqueforti]KAI3206417.1 hypothetical protein CBS147311_2824 [Penicillium roqueforti]KAI3273087.1 hypothetical protein CBS147308_3147 [Penicillium roqueforti]KAI3294540.1 hypothetical protein DTO003C3_2573 [Penicillium roqueforti]